MSGARSAASERLWLLLTLAGLMAALTLAVGALLLARSGAGDQESPLYIPGADDKSLGVNVDLSTMGAERREATLSALEQAGFKWVRQRFAWDQIESEPGVFDWAVYDAIVDDIGRHNLALIALLDRSPEWARADSDSGNPLAPPAESRSLGDWAEALASRYGARIDVYQVWDEPNISPHWGAQAISPTAYGHLLREAAIRIRAMDPEAIILLAALAPNVETGGANLSETAFLEALYRWGGAEWFDGVAVQPYPFGEAAEAEASPSHLNWNRAALVREVMVRNGDAATAVWATAFGAQGEGADAAVLVHQSRNHWPWLGPMVWAAWAPTGAHDEYALADGAGHTGSVWDALSEIAGAEAVAWPGSYGADHPSGQYQGNWRVTPAGADIGGSGDRLAISFCGTRLDLTVRRGEYRAFLRVTVDGLPANALPRDADGRAYVVLYDPLGGLDTVTVAQGLAEGEHRAEIEADRGWGQWAIAGWAVIREARQGAPWMPGFLAVLAVLALGATGIAAWPRREGLARAVEQVRAGYGSLDARLTLLATAGASLLVYASAGPVLTLIALVVLTGLLVLKPERGLSLIALALPFYQPGVALLGKTFSLVEILTLLTALGWLANCGWDWVRQNRPHFDFDSWTGLDWGVLALVVVGGLSLLWAEHSREAAREFRTVVLEAGLYYALLRAMIRNKQDLWRVIDAWVLGAGLVAALGLGQWISGSQVITADGVSRVRALYGSPNNLALYLGRLLPLALSMALFAGAGISRQETARRWAYGLAGLVMAAALLLTYSRGAWLLGIPAAILFLAAVRGRKTFVAIGLVLLVVGVLGVALVGAERLTSLVDTSEGTTFFRLQLWQSSWAMIRDHPLLGVGLDNFLYAYRSHYVLPTAWEEFNLSHPHNLLFDFWLRLGVLGLVVGFWLLISFARKSWSLYRRLAEGIDGALVLGLMGGCVYMVAHGLVDHVFFLVDLAFVFMLMMALVQAVDGQGTGSATAHELAAHRVDVGSGY